jgi:MFS family permease
VSAPLDPAARERLGLFALMAEGLLSRLSFGVVAFALPLYGRKLGLGLAEVGLLVGLHSAVGIALKPAMGWVTDRIGARRALVLAVALRSVVSLLLAFAGAGWQLYGIRALHGLSQALRDPAAGVLLAGGAEKKVASRFAWYQSAKSAGGSLGKGLAGLLLAAAGARYPAVFFAAFALSSLPLLVVVLFVREPEGEAREAPMASPAAPLQVASAPAAPARVLPYAGLGFLVAGTGEMLSQLFPVIAVEHAGLTTAQAGAIYLGASVLSVVGGPIFGWLSDRAGPRPVLLVRGATNILSSVAYGLAPSLAGIAFARCADDLGKAAFRPAWGAIMAGLARQDRATRARTMSWLGMGEDLGEVVGPMLAGLIWGAFGLPAVAAARVALALASEAYALLVAHGPEPSAATPPASNTAGEVLAIGLKTGST